MNKYFNRILTAVFCLFIGGMFLVSTILPDKDFSPLENRYLQALPEFSFSAMHRGDFIEKMEDYTADHIVGRDFWVALNTWCERLTGKKENNGVYFTNGTLITKVDTPTPDLLDKNSGLVNTLVDNVDVPVYFGLIPSAAGIWADRLPAGAPTADESAIIDQMYADSDALTVDLWSVLQAHADEQLYYRTDHHWTSLGAYYGYVALMEAMGMEPVSLEDYTKTVVSEDFYGTSFSTSGVRWLPADTIETYIPADGVTVTAYPDGKPVPGSLYADSFLAEKDKYSYFLGGNKPLCVIETEHTDAPRVLVIRDSYADSLAPFLTESFSEVHLFDLRYNFTSVKDYVEQNGIDRVVVLYSIDNFFDAGSNLFLLGR
ncbi:MAG: hypothetical protein IJA11_02410 [Oscillospiraceae bacterium]|nr:hypothetical protein [Oscillospiraceae bacterium]